MRADTGRGRHHAGTQLPPALCVLPAPSPHVPGGAGPPQPWVGAALTRPPMVLQGQHSSAAGPRAALGARCRPRSNVPAAWGPTCPLHAQHPSQVGAGQQPLPSQNCAATMDLGTTKKKTTVGEIPLSKPPVTICHGCQERIAPGLTQTHPKWSWPQRPLHGAAGGAEWHWPTGQAGMPEPTRSAGASRGSSSVPTGAAQRPRAAHGCALPLRLAARPCALL